MRYLLALGGALALAGCASSERVTLLAPVQPEKIASNDVGAVVVKHGGEETVIDTANEQAGLRGQRPPRVRQLTEPSPLYRDIMSELPRSQVATRIDFGMDEYTLSQQQIDALKAWIADDVSPEKGPRPGRQIIIQAYADSTGDETDNLTLSQRRAASVAQQLREAGVEIDSNDVVGMGEYAARAANGDGVPDQRFRRVDIVVR